MNLVLPDHAVEAAAQTLFGLRAGPDRWPTVLDETRAAYRMLAHETVTAALAAIDPSLLLTEHRIVVTDDGWSLQHPLACRPNLLDCRVHKIAAMGGELLADEVDNGTWPIEVWEPDKRTALKIGGQIVDLDHLGP